MASLESLDIADVAAIRLAAQPLWIATKSAPQPSNAATSFPDASYTWVRPSISASSKTSLVRASEKCAGTESASSVLRDAVSTLPGSQARDTDGFEVPRQVVPGTWTVSESPSRVNLPRGSRTEEGTATTPTRSHLPSRRS